jgi:hypothetical protein
MRSMQLHRESGLAHGNTVFKPSYPNRLSGRFTMRKILPICMATVLGVSLAPLIGMLPLDAHQQKTTPKSVGAMIHLEPDDLPYAGKSTMTWFVLTRRGGAVISPATCDCQVVAYGADKQGSKTNWTTDRLPLSTMAMAGHQKGHQGIRTNITFPKPGSYVVVLSGKSKDGSFNPFEVKFPVTVRP